MIIMRINKTPLEGFLIIEPDYFQDQRGFFLETYQEHRYVNVGINDKFVQDNHSHSKKGVLRGLHFQINRPQAQLVTVIQGHVFDVGVDLRPNSKTFGKWHGVELSSGKKNQVYLAPGFAHGFCVLSDTVDLHYKVSLKYDASDEGGLLWNDPDLAIKWPIEDPIITTRDNSYPRLSELNLQ